MPTPSAPPAPARSLAELNAEIRALLARGGLVTPEGRREYERLLVEWAAAVQDGAEAA